jgi:hypothetical protein
MLVAKGRGIIARSMLSRTLWHSVEFKGGKKAVSFDLGMVVGEGAVAEDEHLARTLESFGWYEPTTVMNGVVSIVRTEMGTCWVARNIYAYHSPSSSPSYSSSSTSSSEPSKGDESSECSDNDESSESFEWSIMTLSAVHAGVPLTVGTSLAWHPSP